MENEIVHDQSDYSVALRREWVADKYLAGVPPALIWIEYGKKYELTKHSFDKDITHVRSNIAVNAIGNYEEIIDSQMMFLYTMQNDAMNAGDSTTALRCQKQITDLLKLITPRQTVNGNTVTFNQQNNNVKLPDNLSLSDIRELLGDSKQNIIPLS